jgi:hypothetical protein
VIHRTSGESDHWLLVEVKGGERSVEKSARAAAYDLLAYRAAFAPVLSTNPTPYGLGLAWGENLAPASDHEMMLCTPDTLGVALQLALG